MADMPRLTLGEVLLLFAILVLAAGTRTGYLITCAEDATKDGPLRVEQDSWLEPRELHELARNIREQQRVAIVSSYTGGETDVAHVSPGYPFLMAAVDWLLKPAMLSPVMRWLQCGLGSLTPVLYFLFARRAFRNRVVAGLTGVLCAIHPFWIIDTATIADGVTATFLLALVLFLGVRAVQTSGPLSSLLFGLALAALALVRAALLPFAFIALAWFLLRSRTLVRGWLAALLAFLGFVNGLAPWTIRNWQLFGRPVPVVTTTYYHLYLGTIPMERRGLPKELWSAFYAMPPALESHYANEIQREIADHPAETVRRRLLAGLDFLFGNRWFKEGRLAHQNVSEQDMPAWLSQPYSAALEITMLVLVVLGLLGWRWTYGWRFSAAPATLAMIWIPLPYVLSHAEELSGPRLPLDGVLLCYAAFSLACLVPSQARLLRSEKAGRVESEAR